MNRLKNFLQTFEQLVKHSWDEDGDSEKSPEEIEKDVENTRKKHEIEKETADSQKKRDKENHWWSHFTG
jgi:hypothetical protein